MLNTGVQTNKLSPSSPTIRYTGYEAELPRSVSEQGDQIAEEAEGA